MVASAEVDDLLRAGVNGLGTDGAATQQRPRHPGHPQEMRVAALLSKGGVCDAASAASGSSAVPGDDGRRPSASLDSESGHSVGKRADVVALSLDDWSTIRSANPISQVVYSDSQPSDGCVGRWKPQGAGPPFGWCQPRTVCWLGRPVGSTTSARHANSAGKSGNAANRDCT